MRTSMSYGGAPILETPMPQETALADRAARQTAVTPQVSAIVQAPAGSGKTYLLAERFVLLLCAAESPDRILALTFGKKAAREIKNRIIHWLTLAQSGQVGHYPQSVHQLLAINRARHWQLVERPDVLHIQTIDAFCQHILHLDAFNYAKGLSLVAAGDTIYDTAVAQLVHDAANESLEGVFYGRVQTLLRAVLSLFHGDLEALLAFLVNALKRRDNWLNATVPFMADQAGQEAFLARQKIALKQLTLLSIRYVREQLAAYPDVPHLVHLACVYLQHQDAPSPLAAWRSSHHLPGDDALDEWQVLPQLLLTTKGDWRKIVNKSLGFPPKGDPFSKRHPEYSAAKQRWEAMLSTLAQKNGCLLECLSLLRVLPVQYDALEQQQAVHFMQLLHIAYVYLQAQFRQQKKIDYTAIATEAQSILANNSDCLRAVSESYDHLLVDEFQDTSFAQLDILQMVTREWHGAQKSVFFVGDPVQSIYAFREAQVAIFQQVWQQGWHQFPLQRLRLCMNFRAQQGLVSWCNQAISSLLPAVTTPLDSLFDAVSYNQAVAQQAPHSEDSVRYIATNDVAHALVAQLEYIVPRGMTHDLTVGVLTYTRKQAAALLPVLEAAGYQVLSGQIVNCNQSEYLRDVQTLLSWAYYPHDRYWQYALLRTHWFALTVAELLLLDEHYWCLDDTDDTTAPDWANSALAERLAQARTLAAFALPKIRTMPWIALMAELLAFLPATHTVYGNTSRGLEALYDALNTTSSGNYIDWQQLLSIMHSTSVATRQARCATRQLELMTIHAAKGLEFDYVFLPFCDQPPTRRDQEHLLQKRFFALDDSQQLLFAVRPVKQSDAPSLYNTAQCVQAASRSFERRRLTYVAVTRAKRALVCIGTHELNAEIAKKSYLCKALLATKDIVVSDRQQYPIPAVADLRPTWQVVAEPADWHDARAPVTAKKPPLIVQDFAHHMHTVQNKQRGNALHSILLQWLQKTYLPTTATAQQTARHLSRNYPLLTATEIEPLCERLHHSLKTDSTAAWLYAQSSIECEKEVYYRGSVYKPDAYFLTEGVVWIIDFKFSAPAKNEDQKTFVERIRLTYQQQLQTYKNAVGNQYDVPLANVRAGLYCPLVPIFFEVV